MKLFKYWSERVFYDITDYIDVFLTLLAVNFVAFDGFCNMTEYVV